MLKKISKLLIVLLCLSGLNNVFADTLEYDLTGDYVEIGAEDLAQILAKDNADLPPTRGALRDFFKKAGDFIRESAEKILDFGEQIVILAKNREPIAKIEFDFSNGIRINASWRGGAPQKYFGYYDKYDDISHLFGFDIDATKFQLGDNIDLRLWKGSYGRFIGGGGEIGIYQNNQCLTRWQVESKLGIIGTHLKVFDKRNGALVTQQTEPQASFWTTAFNTSYNPGKHNSYTENTFKFRSKDEATAFMGKVIHATYKATLYKHNRNEIIPRPKFDGSDTHVTLLWGKDHDVDFSPVLLYLMN